MDDKIKDVLTEKLAELLKDPEKTQQTLLDVQQLLQEGSALLQRLADDVESARVTHKNFATFISRMGLSKEMIGALISKFMGRQK